MACEEVEKRGLRVAAVHLDLGALSGVVKEALLGSYEFASAGTPLEGSRLVFRDVPVVVFCAACGQRRTLPSVQWFRCPECGALTPDAVQGRELQVTAFEVTE